MFRTTNKTFDKIKKDSWNLPQLNLKQELLYACINNILSYQPREHLCLCKSWEQVSTSFDIVNPKKMNTVMSCIYSQIVLNLNEFKYNYRDILFQNVSKEKKNVVILDEFNVDLSKHDKKVGTNKCLD